MNALAKNFQHQPESELNTTLKQNPRPSTEWIEKPIHQFAIPLPDGRRMKIGITDEDRVGMLHHLFSIVQKHGLIVEEGFGGPLQDHNGFFFMVSGEPEKLRRLRQALEEGLDQPVRGEVIHGGRVFDAAMVGIDRTGWLTKVTGILAAHRINMITATCTKTGGPTPLAALDVRFEIDEDRVNELPVVEEKLKKFGVAANIRPAPSIEKLLEARLALLDHNRPNVN